MSQRPIIEVYISYSTAHADQLEALEAAFAMHNEKDEAVFHLQVKFDEECINEGDSIVEFMNDIALAQFVLLLFSEEYFSSPYCLYELITAYQKQDLSKRSFVLPIKFGSEGVAINTYTEESVIDAWQGKHAIADQKDFCQRKLRELLACENTEVEQQIKTVFADFIQPWLDKNLPEKESYEAMVQELEQQAIKAFEEEQKGFEKFILAEVKNELSQIKNLQQSWENYSGDDIKKDLIAARLMECDYLDALYKIQDWAKEEKGINSGREWRLYFKRIQKIAGWLVLRSINQDWWLNNLLSFTDGAKNHGFVTLCLEKKHFSYTEVVVSKALRQSAKFLLDDQNKLIPEARKYAVSEGHDLVFDSHPDATLYTLLLPIVTDLRKTNPQIDGVNELFADLLEIASTNTDNFFYLVTADYLTQLRNHPAPDGSGKTVLEVINEQLKDQLFFIAVETESDATAPQITDTVAKAISSMENILLIDK